MGVHLYLALPFVVLDRRLDMSPERRIEGASGGALMRVQ